MVDETKEENVEVLNVEDSKVKEEDLPPGQDTHVEDLRVITQMLMDAKDLLPGLSREGILEFLDKLLFKTAVYDLKYRVPQIVVDGTVEETTEEKIENLLGHAGYIASFNNIDEKYSVNAILGDDVVIIRDRVKATALMRAVLTRYTRNIYKRLDLEETLISLWMKVNKLTTKDDPRRLTAEDLEKQKEKLLESGINVDEIEKDLIEDKDDIQKKQDLNYQAMKH